jgi:hypothetical protein
MAYTYCSGEFNSTPFSSCCGIASFGKSCDRCGEEITHHEDSASVRRAKELHRQGKCGVCGKPKHACYC